MSRVIFNPDSVAFLIVKNGSIMMTSGLVSTTNEAGAFILGSMMKKSRDKRECVEIELVEMPLAELSRAPSTEGALVP